MFETIIALTSSNVRRINTVKFLKTFASFNWNTITIEINCRPRKKYDGPFSIEYSDFNLPPKKMVRCSNTPLESIQLEGIINNSKLEILCIFSEGNSHWFEAKIEGENKNTVNIIEDQLLRIFKLAPNQDQNLNQN